MTYCLPCAAKNQVLPQRTEAARPTTGTCAICAQQAPVLPTEHFGAGRERLNPAALRAKLQRGVALTNP